MIGPTRREMQLSSERKHREAVRRSRQNQSRRRHKWGSPIRRLPGAVEVCGVCGAVRVTAIPGYHKSPAMLNGVQQRYCPGPQPRPPLQGVGVGAKINPSTPALYGEVSK